MGTWHDAGELAVATDASMAEALGRPSASRDRVDARVSTVTPGIIAGSQTVKDAAVAAMQDAAVIAQVGTHKGVLPSGTDLNDWSRPAQNGVYTLSSASTYFNAPFSGVAATLTVHATDFSGEQVAFQYGSSQVWRRVMNNAALRPRGWGAWTRVDVTRQQVTDLEAAMPFAWSRRGSLADGTDVATLNTGPSNGVWILPPSNSYVGLPPVIGDWSGGMVLVESTGVGDTIQRVVYRFGGGEYTRHETSFGSWSPWRRLDNVDGTPMRNVDELAAGRSDLLEANTPLQPMLRASGTWTTFGAGEAFLDHVARRNRGGPVEVRQIGVSAHGRQVRVVVIGDQTKPALLLLSAVHGNETSSREAMFSLVDRLAANPPTDVCVVIVPTVNPDGVVLVRRTNGVDADVNRRWRDPQPENAAVLTLFDEFDVVAVADCHEGGLWMVVQTAVNEWVDPSPATAMSDVMDTAVHDAIAAYPGPFTAGVWVDEKRVGSSMETFPDVYGVPYLLVEMPGDLTTTYGPDPVWRVDAYDVVLDAIVAVVRARLPEFVAAKP